MQQAIDPRWKTGGECSHPIVGVERSTGGRPPFLETPLSTYTTFGRFGRQSTRAQLVVLRTEGGAMTPEMSAFMEVVYDIPGFTASFLGQFKSADEAVRVLKSLSYVSDRSPQLPPDIKAMVQPLAHGSTGWASGTRAIVMIGGALTADQRVETFRLLHAHDKELLIVLATGVAPPPGAPTTSFRPVGQPGIGTNHKQKSIAEDQNLDSTPRAQALMRVLRRKTDGELTALWRLRDPLIKCW